MRKLLSQLLAVGPELAAYILTASLFAGGADGQFTQTAISSPNLDLSQLGRVALGGDFDSISIQTYQGQNENLSSNGSQSLLARYPNGAFQSLGLVDADASIAAMCPFIGRDGSNKGVIIAGNFTSLAGVRANSIASWNPNTTTVTPLAGLTGPVRALYCDQDSTTVYVGGMFMGGSSTNAMAWTTGWQNLPFAGFNGPVNSITKNSDGNIVFGGQFDGLGNATTPTTPDAQVVNLGSANITAQGTAGGSDPRSIICSTAESGNGWLMTDNRQQGTWQASFGFGFIPTKMRLYNAGNGHGTKVFHFENGNNGGILNLTYTDPSTGRKSYCDRVCPLPENNSTAQDFHFVNPVGINSFTLWIDQVYGSGGGLSGIELFQDDIYSYAVNAFNEPQCDGVSNGSSSTASPSSTWVRKPNLGQTPSDYLMAALDTSTQISTSTNVVFTPNLAQSGNYSVTLYTPGCVLDNTCSTRGQVNVTASLSSGGPPTSTTSFQTNNYDKFEQIYYGYIDAGSSFRPSVTLAPATGQNVPLTVVASRVRFELINSTSGGLNGLYEYNPNKPNANTDDFSTSAINRAGASLTSNALINAVDQYKQTTYVAGNFKGNGISNVMAVTDNATALPGGGLNGEVMDMYLNGTALYLAGIFSNTADNTVTGLNNVASFSIPDNKWSAFGAGVDGAVFDVVPLRLNISTGNTQDCIALSGNFSHVNAFSGNSAFAANGFAVWVLSQNNWLHNINSASAALYGRLAAYTEVPKMSSPLYGGTISSQGLDFSDVVELVGSGQPTLQSVGTNLEQSTNSNGTTATKMKRALSTQSASGQNYTGVYDGIFYQENNLNVTVLGGNFEATASNGSEIRNLIFVNNTASTEAVTGAGGLDSDSIFVAMDYTGTTIFAGGAINGTVNGNAARGLVVYDLSLNQYASPHPAALGGSNVIVNAIAAQPKTSIVYIGGSFETAGSLPCSTLCTYDASSKGYLAVGDGLSGNINAMVWASNTQLIIAGNFSINGAKTTMATYDTKKQTFEAYTGADSLPGPISAITAVNTQYTEFWVSGVATGNNSVYLSKYKGGTWTAAGGLGRASVIRKLQIMPLTSNHASSDLMAQDQSLMIMGNVNIPDQGNASAVLFNGTAYEPFILTNMEDGSEGSLSAIFVSNPQNFMSNNSHHLSLGAIVAIGLAIAAGLIFLMVVAGILLERRRKRKEGYMPMSQEKRSNLSRLPPETLFQNLEGRPSPPKI